MPLYQFRDGELKPVVPIRVIKQGDVPPPPAETDTIGGKGFQIVLPTYDPRHVEGISALIPTDTENFVLRFNSSSDRWTNYKLNTLLKNSLSSFEYTNVQTIYSQALAQQPIVPNFGLSVEII